jgi:protease I
LRGKRCTSFFAIRVDVQNAGGLWEDSEVVIDGNLVSSRKPDDLPAFMRATIAVLAAQ